MQSLLYKYYYEPGFRQNNGPGGFTDMFRATVRGFDFLSDVIAQPEAGSYEWDEDEASTTTWTSSSSILRSPGMTS